MTVTIDAAIQQKAYEQFQGDAAMAVSINPKNRGSDGTCEHAGI